METHNDNPDNYDGLLATKEETFEEQINGWVEGLRDQAKIFFDEGKLREVVGQELQKGAIGFRVARYNGSAADNDADVNKSIQLKPTEVVLEHKPGFEGAEGNSSFYDFIVEYPEKIQSE